MPEANVDAKPLALLIPGLDGTGLLFYRQLEALGRKYRVLPWSYGLKTDADLNDLICDLRRATIMEPAASILLVGESFGGLVAIGYALKCPDRVGRLVLINTFPYYRRRLRVRLARALTPLLRFNAGRKIKVSIIDHVLRQEGIPEEERERYQAAVEQVNMNAYRHRLQVILKADHRPVLGEISAPTILLASGRDKLVPSIREAHYMAARIRNSRVHEFPEAGHALLLTPGVSLADYV